MLTNRLSRSSTTINAMPVSLVLHSNSSSTVRRARYPCQHLILFLFKAQQLLQTLSWGYYPTIMTTSSAKIDWILSWRRIWMGSTHCPTRTRGFVIITTTPYIPFMTDDAVDLCPTPRSGRVILNLVSCLL